MNSNRSEQIDQERVEDVSQCESGKKELKCGKMQSLWTLEDPRAMYYEMRNLAPKKGYRTSNGLLDNLGGS